MNPCRSTPQHTETKPYVMIIIDSGTPAAAHHPSWRCKVFAEKGNSVKNSVQRYQTRIYYSAITGVEQDPTIPEANSPLPCYRAVHYT